MTFTAPVPANAALPMLFTLSAMIIVLPLNEALLAYALSPMAVMPSPTTTVSPSDCTANAGGTSTALPDLSAIMQLSPAVIC